MAGDYQNNAPQKPANALLEYRLRLVGDRLPDGRKDPNFQVNVNGKNEVVLTCNTGLFGADQKQVNIQGKISAITFGAVVTAAEQINSKEPGFRFPLIHVMSPRKRTPQDGPGTPQALAGVVVVGKDADGVCYISLMRKDPPHIKFPFRPDQWAKLRDPVSNQPATPADISNLYSQAWAKVLAPLALHVLSNDVYDFRNDPANNNNNYQQGNSQGYQPNNGQQPQNHAPASTNGFDDDIPM
jgi:hypothetical protein